jgi:chlorite dismutase
VLGHKGDLLLLHFRRTVDELAELEAAVDAAPLAPYLVRSASFLSVVELSLYGASEEVRRDPLAQPWLRRRLYPAIPERRYLCFYPMSRKREGGDNWYLLPFERRRELMEAHGETGRRYADRVTQVITGAVGLDDWEWGVTLWADDPLAFKKLIYEMRFDEVSARYALFGPFYVGIRLDLEDLERAFGGEQG